MKKVFWTSIIWIVLFACFMLYMKRFNQPLAEGMSNFLVKGYEDCTPVEGEESSDLLENTDLETDTQKDFSKATKETIDSKNNLLDVQKDILSNWNKLFDQLDRMEKLLGGEDLMQTKSEDELFDEFQVWYKENK